MSDNQPTTQFVVPAQQPAQQPAAGDSGTVNIPNVAGTPTQQQPTTEGVSQESQPAQQSEGAAQSLDAMSPEQLDQLAERIQQARANRPPSITDALSALQNQLTETHRAKEGAVENRKAASQEADQLQASIQQLHNTIRRTELAEAATAAGFKAPLVVADHLLGQEGDAVQLVTQLAATGAFSMNQPATSAPIGGPASQAPAGMDAGLAALVNEVREAHGG